MVDYLPWNAEQRINILIRPLVNVTSLSLQRFYAILTNVSLYYEDGDTFDDWQKLGVSKVLCV